MKYLCLVYIQEDHMEGMSRSDFDAGMAECLAYGEDLRRSGHYITSAALQTTQTATTVRVRNGKLSATDGPFAETKEQLGGFYLIDARDLNDAIQAVSKMPPARYGSIEVRPIREIDPR